MKATELRIGNWVKSKCHNGLMTEIFSISSIRTVRLGLNPTVNYEIKEVSPIPLTEEILLKCGFFYDVDSDTYKVSDCTLQIDLSDFETAEAIVFAESLRYIKYLHQLQNLYFALTGEELEVKL